MGRQPCCDKVGLKRGTWTAEEDRKLIDFILTNKRHCCWRTVPKLAGLLRCGKSCRLRWINYLRPDLKRGMISDSDEKIIIDLHSKLGNRWSKIAARLPGRTDNEIKNHWNTYIKKKLKKMGVDPDTHHTLVSTAMTDQKQKQKEVEQEDEQQQVKKEEMDIIEAVEEILLDDFNDQELKMISAPSSSALFSVKKPADISSVDRWLEDSGCSLWGMEYSG